MVFTRKVLAQYMYLIVTEQRAANYVGCSHFLLYRYRNAQ